MNSSVLTAKSQLIEASPSIQTIPNSARIAVSKWLKCFQLRESSSKVMAGLERVSNG